jgi:hypothetical protein
MREPAAGTRSESRSGAQIELPAVPDATMSTAGRLRAQDGGSGSATRTGLTGRQRVDTLKDAGQRDHADRGGQRRLICSE